jgi:hypothetical protein
VKITFKIERPISNQPAKNAQLFINQFDERIPRKIRDEYVANENGILSTYLEINNSLFYYALDSAILFDTICSNIHKSVIYYRSKNHYLNPKSDSTITIKLEKPISGCRTSLDPEIKLYWETSELTRHEEIQLNLFILMLNNKSFEYTLNIFKPFNISDEIFYGKVESIKDYIASQNNEENSYGINVIIGNYTLKCTDLIFNNCDSLKAGDTIRIDQRKPRGHSTKYNPCDWINAEAFVSISFKN